jgi:predicted MFS family arabinose efflux permease
MYKMARPMSHPAPEAQPASIRPLALLSIAAFASAATLRVADPLIPQISRDFGVTTGDAGLVVATLFAAAYGSCQIFVGVLGDRFGKYAVVTLATFLCAVATTSAALADGLASLGAARLFSGSFAGALIPLGMAYLGDVTPYEKRQASLARYLSGQIMGVISGQIFGGLFGDYVGWRGIFLALGVIYVAIGLLLWYELGSARVDRRRAPPGTSHGLATRYLQLLADPRVRLIVGTVFIEGFFFFGGFVYIGAFLRDDFAVSYATVGLILAFFGLGGLLYALSVKPLVTRLGERGLVIVGGCLLSGAMMLIATSAAAWWLAPLVAAIGVGFYMQHNTLQTHATQMAPQFRGSAISIFAFAYFVGMAIGIGVFGRLGDAIGHRPVFVITGAALLCVALAYQRTIRRPG